jgi:isoleucyl-tRNA synthetase
VRSQSVSTRKFLAHSISPTQDTVTRYAHQTGHHVTRRFGWDTHGLPIEFEIDKELGIKTRDDVLKLGIPKYNAECRKIVMRYSSEWEKIVGRLGRWIDFKNDYKTLDPSFMESVWWVFGELYSKGLVYRGFKVHFIHRSLSVFISRRSHPRFEQVMPYSVGCTTPLSNFEANMAYREVRDPAGSLPSLPPRHTHTHTPAFPISVAYQGV